MIIDQGAWVLCRGMVCPKRYAVAGVISLPAQPGLESDSTLCMYVMHARKMPHFGSSHGIRQCCTVVVSGLLAGRQRNAWQRTGDDSTMSRRRHSQLRRRERRNVCTTSCAVCSKAGE